MLSKRFTRTKVEVRLLETALCGKNERIEASTSYIRRERLVKLIIDIIDCSMYDVYDSAR